MDVSFLRLKSGYETTLVGRRAACELLASKILLVCQCEADMELGGIPTDQYAGYVEDDSDLEYSECSDNDLSSGDEEESPQVYAQRGGDGPICSDDEFEKEMESEVMDALKLLTSPTALQACSWKASQGGPKGVCVTQQLGLAAGHRRENGGGGRERREGGGGDRKDKDKSKEFYDNVYFDSSSDEGGSGGEGQGQGEGEGREKRRKQKSKVRKLTNDELFYDPHIDEDNERWVARQRMAYHNVKVSKQLEKEKQQRMSSGEDSGREGKKSSECSSSQSGRRPQPAVPQSDAILSCPACMTTLCLDCQRHEVYVTQYRAMFVLNCKIMRDEVLHYSPKSEKKSRKRKRKSGGASAVMDEDKGEPSQELDKEAYHPVRCSECNSEVAVFDKDEVFHFFNVLTSAP